MHLSPRLKGLLNATAIRDMPPYALRRAEEIFNRSEEMAASKGLGPSSWLAPLTATTMAMTSPELMIALFHHATVRKNLEQSIAVAEFMREIGLLCIAVIGIPRTNHMLVAFRASLPLDVARSLTVVPSRYAHIEDVSRDGRELWNRIHHPLDKELERMLQMAHPDLPMFVIDHVYGLILAHRVKSSTMSIGRLTLSLSAIAVLRVQRHSAAQLGGHIRGLKKAWEDGSWDTETQIGSKEAIQWLVSDVGCVWLLRAIDDLARVQELPRDSRL